MYFPKNDKEIRMYCLSLAESNEFSKESNIDLAKAKEYYDFITASSSKPSVWKRLALALSNWCAKLRHLFHR